MNVNPCDKCDKYRRKEFQLCAKCGKRLSKSHEERKQLLTQIPLIKDKHQMLELMARFVQIIDIAKMYIWDHDYYTKEELLDLFPITKLLNWETDFRKLDRDDPAAFRFDAFGTAIYELPSNHVLRSTFVSDLKRLKQQFPNTNLHHILELL